MSAFVIVHVRVNDADRFKEYAANAPKTVADFDGKFILRGKVAEVLHGEHDHTSCVVIEFPDRAAAKRWYDSPQYQDLIPNRDAAADMTFVTFEPPT